MMLGRIILVTTGLLILWQSIVMIFHLPGYILPTPIAVFIAGYHSASIIFHQMFPTIIETLLGFFFGACFGALSAVILIYFRPARLWFLPLLLISQALPTFAIAPLLVVWFGYGMSSKIITTIIMLFFPIANAFYDGLKQVDEGWLQLAQTMHATKWRLLWHIQIPAALPNLATGLRVASALAPLGAIVGEWVGASEGLGFLMLNANARMQIDLMFAVLLALIAFTMFLYFSVDRLLTHFIRW